MANIVKRTDDLSARARADRSIQSGRVLESNRVANVAHLDVGMVDFDGNGVTLEDVAFSPQSPPHAQDTVSIVRTNSSPYSHVIGGGAGIGGANSGQVVDGVGGMGSVSSPTHRGQILYCEVAGTWVAATPVVSDDFGIILTEPDTGYIVVAG